MTLVEDKRALAREYEIALKNLGASGKLPSAKELAREVSELGVDQHKLKELIRTDCELVGRVKQSTNAIEGRETESEYYEYTLSYTGKPARLSYVRPDGTTTKVNLGEFHLAEFRVKHTNYFPNALVDELLRMHAQGAGQHQLYEHMTRFYADRGYALPDFEHVKETQTTVKTGGRRGDGSEIRWEDPGFRNQNLFLIWMSAHECTRGINLSTRIIKTIMGTSISQGCKYAIVYTRMAEFAEKTGKQETATPEEARQYFEDVRKSGWGDWSIRFHVNAGAKMLFALPQVATDAESRGAGALGIYDLEELRKTVTQQDRLKTKHKW